MRFGHVLLTVFSPGPRSRSIFPKGARLDEDWLHDRWQLFTAYAVPSVAAQSESDFTWLVICPPESPAWFRALTGTADAQARAHFCFSPHDPAIGSSQGGAFDALLVTTLGPADALHRRAMERIREDCEADPYTSATVTLTDGYLLEDTMHRMRPYHGLPERFRTRIDLGPYLDPLDVRGSHRSVGHGYPARSISEGEPMFVLVSHERPGQGQVAANGDGHWLGVAATADILDHDFGVTLAALARRPRARPVSKPGWLAPRPAAAAGGQRVVVSIPCFQAWPSLAGAVESVLSQTHQDLLVIVANDGDDQPRWEVLSHLDDPRLVRIDHPVNCGRYFIDQTVLMARLGRYLLIHDADEWSEPDRVQCLLAEMRRSHSVAVVSAHYQHEPDAPGSPAVSGPPLSWSQVTPLYPDGLTGQAGSAYRALFDIPAVLNVGGCYGGYRLGYDTFLAHLIRMAGGSTGLRQPLYHRIGRDANSSERSDPAARQDAATTFAGLYQEAYHLYCEYLQGSVGFSVLCRHLRGLAWRHVSASEWDALCAESGRLRWEVKTGSAAGRQPEPAPRSSARARPPSEPGLGDRLFAAYTVPVLTASFDTVLPTPQQTGAMVIAGVLTAQSRATLGPDAVAYPLLPHDAAFMLERTGADLVLLEAAAMLPGSAWSYAAHPAAADRGRKLADLVDAAHGLGQPVVFLRNVPNYRIPGLGWLDAMCDVVLHDDLGVQLTRFNPIDLPATRTTEPLYVGAIDPGEGRGRRYLLDQLTRGDRPAVRIAEVPWRELPGLYRRHGLFLAASAAQAREQHACGARVVGPVGYGAEPGPLAPDLAAVAAELDAARAAGVPLMTEVRQVLRDIFQNDATRVRLDRLARMVGLPVDVCAARQIAVLAEVRDAAEADTLVQQLLRQRLRPVQVVIYGAAAVPPPAGLPDPGDRRGGHPPTRALAALADAGIAIQMAAVHGEPEAARQTELPWIVPWDCRREHSDWYLLDLMCARECSAADIVGHAADQDYVFVDVAEPALVRRDLLLPGAPPQPSWSRRGARILSVAR